MLAGGRQRRRQERERRVGQKAEQLCRGSNGVERRRLVVISAGIPVVAVLMARSAGGHKPACIYHCYSPRLTPVPATSEQGVNKCVCTAVRKNGMYVREQPRQPSCSHSHREQRNSQRLYPYRLRLLPAEPGQLYPARLGPAEENTTTASWQHAAVTPHGAMPLAVRNIMLPTCHPALRHHVHTRRQ